MGQKDLSQKNLEMYPDVFADMVNALYYKGQCTVREEELKPAPTESLYSTGRQHLKNQFQDVSMYLIKGGQIKMCYMLENQMKTESKMVLRKAGYEGAIYRRQFDEKEVYPVAGLVLYWGKGHWRAPRSLKDQAS
ncbi:MAG: Rpn family recombination-promoting nuclease/putative transposase [Lachnospiraceae bacterium]|nr:Rpn family recombination-promoting nuclease/putative transposase [Lachnospiraceae bacterium]